MRDQAPRLIRERWADVNEFAEEMFAIWTSDKGVTMDGPVTINNSTGGSSLTINQGDIGETTITINNNPTPGGPGDTTVINNTYITNIYGDGGIEGFPDPPPGPEAPQPGTGQPAGGGGGGGGGFPGVVVSGSGDTYQVAVRLTSLTSTPVTKTVKQLSIDASETIPAGTAVVVNLVGADYFMQVPVWADDA